GRTSIATHWRCCGLPQSASCSENFVIPPDVFGQTLRISVLAMLPLFMGCLTGQADDQTFTVRIENVSAKDALKISNGKTEPVGVAPVLYIIHTNRAPLFT